jgi:TPR repeat protein
VVDRSLKTFLRVTMTTMLLLGPLRPATAWAQLESAAAKAEPPLDEAKMKALIQRVRAGDDAAIAEFEKFYTSLTENYYVMVENKVDPTNMTVNYYPDISRALAGESVEVRTVVRAYIFLSIANWYGSSEAGTIRDMLVEGVKFEKLAYAQNVIAERFFYGVGIPNDDVEAVKWFRLAAAQGDATAQKNLGWMYFYGAGVPENAVEAVSWFRLSAVSGNRDGEFALAVMYDEGAGIGEDDAQAINWYTLAAKQGQIGAQLQLGVMYAAGEGVVEDDVVAVKWYRAAAMQGVPAAQLMLGRMYRDGEGVPKDLVTAYAWLLLAMEGVGCGGEFEGLTAKDVGDPSKDFRRLEKRLSASQREQAEELANRLLEEK